MAQDGIDRHAIETFMKGLQREFDKHPISVPLEADGSSTFSTGDTIYNGPVFHGSADGAQLAWNNETAHQTQNHTERIAPGFEAIAQAVVRTLEMIPAIGLTKEDQQDADVAAHEVLTEVTREEPDRGKIRRALSTLKGLLAPVATGLANATEEGTQELARAAIEQLGTPF